jgi:hypothetical protein
MPMFNRRLMVLLSLVIMIVRHSNLEMELFYSINLFSHKKLEFMLLDIKAILN